MRNLERLQQSLKSSGKITIIGHDNIDVDSFLSGVLLSHLLDFLQIKNEFLILEEIRENETYQIIEEVFQINLKDFCSKKEDLSRDLFLVDHYKTEHEGKVIACVDHHPTTEMIKYPFYYSRISCSTSYMVYELMQEAGYQINYKEAMMILVSMMIDTVSFKNSKTVQEEVVKAKELAKQYELDYFKIEKYCLCLTPIDNMSINTIVNNGYKYYNYNGQKVKSSYIQIYEMMEKGKVEELIKYIQKRMQIESLQMWVFIIFQCKEEKTYEYQITLDSANIIESDGILSRGSNIMPKIEKLFVA